MDDDYRRSKGRLTGEISSVILAERDKWPVFRLSQAVAYMEVPKRWGAMEQVVLLSAIAWAYSEDDDVKAFDPPGTYFARITGCNDWGEFEKALRTIAEEEVVLNTGNLDRLVGKKLKAKLIEVADEGGRFAFRFTKEAREAILYPAQYVRLELRVVANLKSKYALRLYPLLAIAAGRSAESETFFEAKIRRLVQWLGVPSTDGTVPFGGFRKDILKPALKAVANAAPSMFRLDPKAKIDTVTAVGRGRRVESVRIPLSVTQKRPTPATQWTRKPRLLPINSEFADALEDDSPLDVDDLVRGFEDSD